MSIYLYEDTTLNMAVLINKGFIFPFPAGSLMVITRAEDEYINLQAIYDNKAFRQNTNGQILDEFVPVTSILKQNGDAYTTIAGLMSAINPYLAGNQSGGALAGKMEVEFTRPDDTTAYTAGDVVAPDTGIIEIPDISKAVGKAVTITGVGLKTDSANAAGASFVVRLFDEQPAIIDDNDPFVFDYDNKIAGEIPLLIGTGARANYGQTMYESIKLKPTTRSAYAQLTTGTAYTPASEDKYTLIIHYEQSN